MYGCIVCLSKLISFKLLDVAEGLNYLHTCHMVHGDLKGVSGVFVVVSGQSVDLFQAKYPNRRFRARSRLRLWTRIGRPRQVHYGS